MPTSVTDDVVGLCQTIGDCYMAVTNLVEDQSEDHVARVANFSLAVLQVARSLCNADCDSDVACAVWDVRGVVHVGSGLGGPRRCGTGAVLTACRGRRLRARR